MTTLEEQFKNDEKYNQWAKNQLRGQIFAGILVLAAAGLFFVKELGYTIPEWIFSWQTMLIAIGLTSGVKHKFRNFFWIIMVTIGGVFLIGEFFPLFAITRFKIPIILLIIGLFMIFRPKHRYKQMAKYKFSGRGQWNTEGCAPSNNSSDDYFLMNNLFGATKKNIFSKDFKGGDMRNTFGGCELNLMQAEIINEAVININQNFGGTKIIVPSHWIIKSDLNCVFGGIEDERGSINQTANLNPKTLVLKGHVFMGGVEIVSY